MKIRFLTIISLSFSTFFFANQSFGALNGGSPTPSGGSSTQNSGSSSVAIEGVSLNKSFSESVVGAGLYAGARFNLAEDIFADSEDKNSETKDHIFSEIEAFGNHFFSGEIKQNFGGGINLGYEIKGIRIYGSGGYVISTMDYQETGNAKQSVTPSTQFFGLGLGYDITKRTSIRLNSMFYNFDFVPKNSGFKNVEVNVSSINLGLGFHF
jgi:hypothetical protein